MIVTTLPAFLKPASKIALSALILAALTSCQASTGTGNKAKVDENSGNITSFTSVLTAFSCKPTELAFVAAHRGTHEGSAFPENALESLQELHRRGVPFAEIDVARLRGGTHILFHDGVWDKRATGQGPIAATDWAGSQKLLLKDTNGNVTTYRPSKLSDVLIWAKDKIYLEIDFKSSANEAKVIDAIRAAGMLDQVILISYTTEQALRLHKLAPKAALSVGIFKPGDIKALEARGIPVNVMTAWTGRGPLTENLASALRARNIPILAPSFYGLDDELQNSKDFGTYIEFAKRPDLIVTDFAYDAQQAIEITGKTLEKQAKCLISKTRK